MTSATSPLARMGRALLVLEFTAISAWYITIALFVDRGSDARIYLRATQAWLHGGNPWTIGDGGVLFAAPPPTLLFTAPFTLLPEDLAVTAIMATSVGAAVFVLRRLRLPAYYLLFPPIVEAVCVGNPDVLVVALLVGGAGVVAALAKIYAIVPLLIGGRWKQLMVIAAFMCVTAPLLPWSQYAAADALRALARQAGGRSAFEIPPLIPFVLLALWRLGRARAAWLAVPGLWPSTQLHYATIGLPAITAVMAAFMALPLPGSAAIGIIVGAAAIEIDRRRVSPPPAAAPAPPP